MDLLTRAEELVLLAVWKLGKEAYSVSIRDLLNKTTGQYWSFGAVYMPLDRLVKRNYLNSNMADPTAERGGRSKRMYVSTKIGLDALTFIRKIQNELWEGTPTIQPEDA